MNAGIFYILMAIIQGQGAQAEVYGKLEDCEMEREQRLAAPDTLALSACVRLEMVPAKMGYDKGVKGVRFWLNGERSAGQVTIPMEDRI